MSDETEFDLVMPFVVVESVGGPYPDEAFVAGWECATIDIDLARAHKLGANIFTRVVRPALMPQIDLLAMRHSFTARISDGWNVQPGWDLVVFEAAAPSRQETQP